MDNQEAPAQGWKFLINAPKAHYFIGGRSLCGKWMTFSDKDLEDYKHDHSDNCKACQKKRAARLQNASN